MEGSLISHQWWYESEARFAWSASQLEAIEWYPGITICTTNPESKDSFGGDTYEFATLRILRLGC